MTEPEKSPLQLQAKAEVEKALFESDPWWAIEQGLVFTEDEHAQGDEDACRPFPPKEYLRAITRLYQQSNVGIVMKARQLMMSWLFCWFLLHEAISKDGRLCVAQGKREEDVLAKGTKALMGRIRYMRRRLPKHLQPLVLEESKSTEVYANGSTIIAIPQGEDIIRSLTASAVFMDELARHPNGEAAWTAALPTIRGGGKLWGVTTPNGREFCYQQADERLPWDKWEQWPQVMEGVYGYQNTKGMFLVALHYTADDAKRSPAYQLEARRGYTNVNYYRQENELDFSMQPGEGVFAKEFMEGLHLLDRNYRINPFMPMYRGWDFGYNGQAISFFQHNHRGQLVWFDQVFFKRLALPLVCQEVIRRTLFHLNKTPDSKEVTTLTEMPLKDLEGREIDGARLASMTTQVAPIQAFDFGDPSGETHNTRGETDRLTLMTFGFQLRTKPTTGRKRDLVENIRALLLPRSDGTPGMLISPGPAAEMRYVKEGFLGGYHYPEVTLGRADKMLPQKDGFYDHIFDSCQYAVDHIRPIQGAMVEEIGQGADWWKSSDWAENPWAGTGET
jgi:hypothetical protein